MVETQRSITDLYTRHPDNTSQDVSNEDVRDIVETLRAGHAEYATDVPAATVIAVAGTFVKVAGTTLLTPFAHNWTMPVDNRLLYGGTARRVTHLACTISFTSVGNNQEIRFRIAKNGVTIPRSEVQRFVGTGADVASTALHNFNDALATDFFELWVANVTSTSNITVTNMNLFIMDMALV